MSKSKRQKKKERNYLCYKVAAQSMKILRTNLLLRFLFPPSLSKKGTFGLPRSLSARAHFKEKILFLESSSQSSLSYNWMAGYVLPYSLFFLSNFETFFSLTPSFCRYEAECCSTVVTGGISLRKRGPSSSLSPPLPLLVFPFEMMVISCREGSKLLSFSLPFQQGLSLTLL